MSVVDQCPKSIHPRQAKKIFISTLGVNLVANLHFEVYMGMEKSPITGDSITNDWPDLTAGLVSTATYSILAHSFDSFLLKRLKTECN